MGHGSQFPYLEGTELEEVSVEFADIGGRLVSVLEEHGFAVVNDVLNSEDVMELQALFGRDLMDVCDHGINSTETNPTTVLEAYGRIVSAALIDVPRLWPGIHRRPSLAASFGIPQGRFAWAARMHPNIRAIYRLCHKDELEKETRDTPFSGDALSVGMDQVFFKPEHSACAAFTDCWGHADLNIHCSDGGGGRYRVYQSIVSLWPSLDMQDSTTVVWPRSHRNIFPSLMIDTAAVTNGKIGGISHFTRVDGMKGKPAAPEYFSHVAPDMKTAFEEHIKYSEDPKYSQRLHSRWSNERYLREARRVPLAAGSLIIWDSRTVHQGWDEGRRLAMPVCWEPRGRMSEVCEGELVARRKLRIAASGRCTTHWASLGREHSVPSRKPSTTAASNDNCSLVELATSRMLVPYCVSPEFAGQYPLILELCEQLKQSGDTDDTVAELLRSMMRPDIIAIL
jgi:hypothetical protein